MSFFGARFRSADACIYVQSCLFWVSISENCLRLQLRLRVQSCLVWMLVRFVAVKGENGRTII
jgi:hypothetical protein